MSCLFYLPAITEPRARAILAAIESTLPTAPLVYRIALTGSIHRVDDPGAWCAAHLAKVTPAVICNGNEDDLVSLMAWTLPRPPGADSEPLIQMRVELPSTRAYVERVPDLFCALGPAAHAYWGIDLLGKASYAISEGAGRISPDPGFPPPVSPSVAIPARLSWVSYWSAETCRRLAFAPEDSRASLFSRVIPVEGHGVVVQLTDAPLDLERPEHLAALTAVYEAFPAIDQKRGPF